MNNRDKVAPVSMLVPVRNGMPFVVDTIASLQMQTMPAAEILVVDDGSTDDTPSALAELAGRDSRIRVIAQPPSGLVAALNHGLRQASQPWIGRIDADDLALPERIERQMAFLRANQSFALVGCAYRFIDRSGRPFGFAKHLPMAAAPAFDPMVDPNVPHQGVIFRRDVVVDLGGYRETVPAEDLDLWLRMAEVVDLGYLDEVLVSVRILADGISASRFVEQRIMWRYVRECAKARRRGEEEPAFEDWRASYQPSDAKLAKWHAQRDLRLGAALMAERRYFSAAARFASGLSKSPRAVLRKAQTLSVGRRK